MVDSSTKKSSTNGFYYHADANPIGGTIHRPFSGFIPSNASISLPLVGGFLEKQGRGRKWKNTVTYTSESTHVSGSRKDEANGGPWTTQVSATIEGLNILEVVTADKIVAQLSVAHSPDGGSPTVSVVGSQFINLRISGMQIEPVIKYDLFADHDRSTEKNPAKRYPQQPWPQQPKLLDKARAQYDKARDGYLNRYQKEELPDWYTHHFRSSDAGGEHDDRDYILCSLVDSIPGVSEEFPGFVCGHVIRVPDFGKVYLGELLVHNRAYTVSMIRAELGSPVGGSISAATARSNGHPDGP